MTSSSSPGSLSIGALSAAGVERKEKSHSFGTSRSCAHRSTCARPRRLEKLGIAEGVDATSAKRGKGKASPAPPEGGRGRTKTANRPGPLLPARPERREPAPHKQEIGRARGPGGTGEEGKREVRGNGGRGKARGRGNGGYLGSEHHHRRRTPYERRKRRTRGESPDAYSQGEIGRS